MLFITDSLSLAINAAIVHTNRYYMLLPQGRVDNCVCVCAIDNFTDAAVSGRVNGEHKEKDLEPWDGGETHTSGSLESLDTDVVRHAYIQRFIAFFTESTCCFFLYSEAEG